MEGNLLSKAFAALQDRKRRRRWSKVVSAMACVVVFCTTYALILPAITLAGTSYCGLEEHTHVDTCYTDQLVCQIAEGEGHTHTQECYTQQQVLSCGLEESEGHTHDASCVQESKALSCGLEESSGHTHSDACYDGEGNLICTEEEREEHSHSDDCYTVTQSYVCGLEESEGHTHSESCYETQSVLTCQLEETEGHVHTDACYEQVQTCTLEEHTHTQACFSNPEADVETAADWEKTLPEELTGVWADDVIAVAESQLGYQESEKNYSVTEDGERKGYTRYGAWYGDSYGDWCAMFVSFCLNYAQVEDFPLEAGCQRWVEILSGEQSLVVDGKTVTYDFYRPAEEYTPVPGDLIFFDTNRSSDEDVDYADHVGLVVEVTEASDTQPALIKTIEGNSGDQVRYRTYELEDETILGYAQLPEKPVEETEEAQPETEGVIIPYTCALEEHTHSDACYGEDGSLTCGLEEHTHSDACLPQTVSDTYYCGLEEHTHSDACYGEDGSLTCGLEEHTHTSDCGALTDEEWAQVQQVIALIDEMPSSEEIDAKLMEYEDAGDLAGQDVYFEEVWTQVCEIYDQYALLSDKQKACVTNADKLLALEYMWGNQRMTSTYATSYTTEVSGYNLEANNIYPIDGFLGKEAAYRYDGTTLGTYNTAAKNILDKANVIYVDLPVNANGERCSLGNYLLGKNHASLLTAGGVQGTYGVDLNAEWCALRVEKAATEYPGYIVKQVAYKDSDVTRIGRLSVTTDAGFILLIRSSLIEKNDLYIPGEGEAYLHLNKELLQKIKGWTSFEADLGYLPSNHSSNASYVPLAYATLSPVAQYDANGKRIGDAGARPDDMKVVDNIKFKLFDYSEYINKVDRTETDSDAVGTIHSKYRALAKYFYFRGGFESAGKDYGLDVARYTPNVNTVKQDGGGNSTYDQDGYTVNHARVEPNLWNGYPILDFTVDAKGNPISAPSDWGTGQMMNPRSLRFLFDQDYAYSFEWTAPHKIAIGAVTEYSPTNTILQFNEDTHTYWYDSAKHAVDYDIDAQKFRVRKYTERTSITADWPFDDSAGSGDFLPFNYSNGIVNATYHSGSQPGVKPVADSSFRMNDVDYWFGMSMEFSFIQGKDGTVTYTNSSGERKTDPMVFEFSGDDDVWVFIDGVRILDLGGTHGSVTGIIDFTTGKVTQKLTWGEDPNKSYPTTLEKCFDLAGKSPKGGWDDTGERFADYSVHTLKFFYLERGTAVANCSIKFNLPNFDTPLVVGKTLNPADETVNSEVLEYLRGNTEYSYRVLEANADGTVKTDESGNPILFIKGGQKYTLVDHENPQRLGVTMTVGENGIFKLKHGQQAVFEDILGIAGYEDKYFVIEEILPDSQTGHYNKVQYTINADIGTMMGKEDDTLEDFMGYYSPAISAGEPQQVQYTNVVDTDTLSVLKVTKKLDAAYSGDTSKSFTFNVTLDGEPLPVGTSYTVTSEDGTETTATKQVETAGQITLTADQTALISNILAGTQFEVTETEESATGYTVGYKVDDGQENTSSAAGTVGLNSEVEVTVNNSEIGTSLSVPVWKNMAKNSSYERAFTFTLQRVTSQTDLKAIGDPQTLTIKEVGLSDKGGEFLLSYIPAQVTDESGTQTFYYKISENAGTEDRIQYDTTYYILEVTVTKSDSKVSASITKLWKNGTEELDVSKLQSNSANNPIIFTNVIVRTLTLSKTVVGSAASKANSYTFTVTLEAGDSGTELPTMVTGTLTKADGSAETVSYEVTNGTFTVELTDGESVTLNNMAYCLKYTITETTPDGFKVTYTTSTAGTTTSTTAGEGNSVTGTMGGSNITVSFTNTQLYSLPEAGGTGTYLYTLGGALLMTAAPLVYGYSQRRKREGRADR